MLVLGLSGGLNEPHRHQFDFPWFFHDGAAVLVEDGRIVAGVEEERLNRIKHTTCLPRRSIRHCLDERGVSLGDIDRIGYFFTEEFVDGVLRVHHFQHPHAGALVSVRARLERFLFDEFGGDAAGKLVFIPHHLAHAASAYHPSGFDSSLVLVVDGMGDNVAVSALSAEGRSLKVLQTLPPSESLGIFYALGIHFLGYGMFDEYKVMGLAPYGDPIKYRSLFRSFYSLLPEGRYAIHRDRALHALYSLMVPRRRGEPFAQLHMDLAAALQSALAELVFHVLRHWRKTTGHRNLCLAGGVAHNCTVNGEVLYANLFDQVFVQPAAHDAGCALGAALHVHHLGARTTETATTTTALRHVYWGPDIGNRAAVLRQLERWSDWITWESAGDAVPSVARALAGDKVVGWVQGRSEFGPRALGNRSILADPRPTENKHRINRMIKKRESYRPFAPAVLQEAAGAFFDLPATTARHDFMTFVVKVRPEKQQMLGAVTHVDGTARIQMVSRAENERFWRLIHEFGQLTSIPVLLNTSFNNNVEPIVDSVGDAVACFLTTGLDLLAVGDFVVERRAGTSLGGLRAALPPQVRMRRSRAWREEGLSAENELADLYSGRAHSVSDAAFDTLFRADGSATLDALLDQASVGDAERPRVLSEIVELWSDRVLVLGPA
jgi:carbamoyltransferase